VRSKKLWLPVLLTAVLGLILIAIIGFMLVFAFYRP
jgi:uncharacterized protein (DUF2062 family)